MRYSSGSSALRFAFGSRVGSRFGVCGLFAASALRPGPLACGLARSLAAGGFSSIGGPSRVASAIAPDTSPSPRAVLSRLLAARQAGASVGVVGVAVAGSGVWRALSLAIGWGLPVVVFVPAGVSPPRVAAPGAFRSFSAFPAPAGWCVWRWVALPVA